MRFCDRIEAGQKLAKALQDKTYINDLVLAIPRGGVVVGAQIAKKLGLPLDLIIPRKIGSPQNPEAAIGAVAQDGTTIFDHHILKILGLKEEDLKEEVEEQIREIRRRLKHYRGTDKYPKYDNKQIILADDGVATGYTVLAALRSIKNIFSPQKLTLAIPVAPQDTLQVLKAEVDDIVCLLAPANFYAVAQFYEDFTQTKDEEVIFLLNELLPKKS